MSEEETVRGYVLVADDNVAVAAQIWSILDDAGFAVNIVHDGHDAAEEAARHLYDLLLVDAQLPGMSGPEVVAAVRALPAPQGEIPAVALVRAGVAQDNEAFQAVGVATALAKPVDSQILLDTVITHMAPMPELAAQPLPLSAEPAPAIAVAPPPEPEPESPPPAVSVAPEAAPDLLVVDLEHLSKYTGGDRNLERELFQIYVPNGEEYLDAMQQAIGNGDDAIWRRSAHSLKGASRGIGAFPISNIAEEAEKLQDGDSEERERLVGELRVALEQVRAFAERHFQD